MSVHIHVHVHDAPAAFEAAKHPRIKGKFVKGGGGEPSRAAEDPAHRALPVSTGGSASRQQPTKDKKRRRRVVVHRARDSRAIPNCSGKCGGTPCSCRGQLHD